MSNEYIERDCTIYLVPKGKPSAFAMWHNARPKPVLVTRETSTDWYGTPRDNPQCPVLQWPKFAWQVYTAQDAIRDILDA